LNIPFCFYHYDNLFFLPFLFDLIVLQQPNHPQPNNGSDHHSTQLLPPLPQQQQPHVGSIRPGSMADRARLAKIPPPEAALKCPRCDSTNTKFCYFNNYSLSQPRHFCKTCRRYWTRGGALRNVPVGGGCRRNKKNKRSRSKSPSTDKQQQQQQQQTLLSSSPSAIVAPPSSELISQLPPQPPNLPFMASLQNLNRFGVGNIGLNDHMGFQLVNSVDQWRLQQIPNFLNGFESTASAGGGNSNYPYHQSEGTIEGPNSHNSGLVGDIGTSSRVSQIKMEEAHGAAMNLSRSPLNVTENNQYFSWTTDMSGLASSNIHLL